jgi:transcriptional regulator
MYLPAHYEISDADTVRQLIATHPLGTWVVTNGNDLIINHIPFLLDETRGSRGTLIGHVARANPVWKQLQQASSSAVVFHAEQGYISPNWYPGKQQHHRVVPTWNYAVVHVHGKAQAIEDRSTLLNIVTALTKHQEAKHENPWRVSDAPAAHIEKLLGAIVGIEITIDTLIGKFKLSQNQAPLDRQGAIAGLQDCDDDMARALALRMKQTGK